MAQVIRRKRLQNSLYIDHDAEGARLKSFFNENESEGLKNWEELNKNKKQTSV
jgi:hypothetical protein